MEPLPLLKKLVSINSVFGSEGKLGEFLEEQLRKLGFSVKRVEIAHGRFNVIGERGSRGKPILLYGHMDTVPPYGEWKGGKPFALREEGDRLSGLGVFDMKAGVAAILCACEEKTERRLRVVFCVDEENDSEGSHAVAAAGLFDGVEAVLSTEIATGTTECRGPREITLGRRGRCVIEIAVPGKSAHGANAARGVNAISEAARLALELERLNGRLGKHPLLPPPTLFVRKISGESTSLSVPEAAMLELDIHLVVPQTPKSMLNDINMFIDGLYATGKFSEMDGRKIEARLKERKVPYLAPYATPQENPQVQLLTGIVKEKFGEVHYAYGASVADDNVLAVHAPTFSIGPMGGGEHTRGEWASKESYLQLVEIVREFVRRL
jgi:acetylornithine deacetylase/succinyl-diaminopimelate desuccinylase-like protein